MIALPDSSKPLILQGHVLDRLKEIPDESIALVCTSTPYWRQRNYGTPPQVWGGASHEHVWTEKTRGHRQTGGTSGIVSSDLKQQHAFDSEGGYLCECGAWKGELGQESTPELFVSHVADVMGEVLRVLKTDGSLWLNTASTYSTHPAGVTDERRWQKSTVSPKGDQGALQSGTLDKRAEGWPEKELIPIPWMLGLEMHRRGWRIRADVQWWKVNPKRDSAKDRPARCHEYVTMFTKGPNAYYNEEGVRQPYSEATLKEVGISYRSESKKVMVDGKLCSMYERANAEDPSELKRRIINSLASRGGSMLPDVWYLATGNGEGRHVAVFPEQLPELCITAGSRPGDIVLDPFAGSGTTLQVARRLGRRSIGIELSQESVAYMGEKLARPQVASLMGFGGTVEEGGG